MTLKEALSEVGMKQVELAKLSGVNVRQINRIVAGESKLENITAKNLLAISSALNMTVEELMSNEPGPSVKISFTSEADALSPEERCMAKWPRITADGGVILPPARNLWIESRLSGGINIAPVISERSCAFWKKHIQKDLTTVERRSKITLSNRRGASDSVALDPGPAD